MSTVPSIADRRLGRPLRLEDSIIMSEIVPLSGPSTGRSDRSDRPLLLKYTGNNVTTELAMPDKSVTDLYNDNGLPQREKWTSKIEFLLAIIGFSVDLGNVWRFPYVCYRNGGGAFLIPYCTMFLFGGLPLFYMELALGQYHRSGCISIWKKLCPIFKGIGYAICIINSCVAFYYNTILSWALYYLLRSFSAEVPWKYCNQSWNTPNCSTPEDAAQLILNLSQTAFENNESKPIVPTWVLPAEEFFRREVLQSNLAPQGLNDVGAIRWQLALCLLAIYLLVYFALWKGPRSTGKAVWITATLPYLVLFILLIRGVTLPGAMKGIEFYLKPNLTRLLERGVWIDAATQIFFSLGPGFGVLLALASYNEFNNNCYKDAIITSLVNSFTSFLSGFVIFAVLGYMSYMLHTDVSTVAGVGGPGLIFIVYPQAIATMVGAPFWAIIFFIMLITLGLDSTFGGLESVITGLCDEFPNTFGRKRELFVLGLTIYCYLGSLPTTTYGGEHIIDFLDHYGVSLTVVFAVAIESVAVCWFYGARRFSDDVQEMLGFRPGIFWRVCWTFISPIFIFAIFIFAVIDLKPPEGHPAWSLIAGWMLRLASLILIPVFAIYTVLRQKGTALQRLKAAITPQTKATITHEVYLPPVRISPSRDDTYLKEESFIPSPPPLAHL